MQFVQRAAGLPRGGLLGDTVMIVVDVVDDNAADRVGDGEDLVACVVAVLPGFVFRIVEAGQVGAGVAVADAAALVVDHLRQFAAGLSVDEPRTIYLSLFSASYRAYRVRTAVTTLAIVLMS